MEYIKKNIQLIVAFSLPLLFILFVLIYNLFLISFITPEYNFVYSICPSGIYNCRYNSPEQYIVVDNKIALETVDQKFLINNNYFNSVNSSAEQLFIYDSSNDSSRAITFEEARQLTLDSKITSPDGYFVEVNSNNSGFFPFDYSRNGYSHAISDGKVSKKINIIKPDDNYYSDDFKFIGWIIE